MDPSVRKVLVRALELEFLAQVAIVLLVNVVHDQVAALLLVQEPRPEVDALDYAQLHRDVVLSHHVSLGQ